MDIHQIFQRLILRRIESNIQKCNTGRPKEINNKEALQCMFKVLRAGLMSVYCISSVVFW